MTSISGPGGNSVYIKQEAGVISWSSDTVNWTIISSFPITIINSNPGIGILTLVFTTNLTLSDTNQYFRCGSSNIQFGSDTLNADGSRPTIYINFNNYDGLIDNASGGTGYDNITIKNLVVDGDGYSTQIGAGWIGKKYFAQGAANNQIINCSTKGNINATSGGIIGQYACIVDNSSLTITNCTSSGDIGNNGGGIIGSNCAEGANSIITIIGCSSIGIITDNAGGITGNSCGINGGTVNITNSYSGGIIGANGGGIFGSSCGSAGTTTATNCYNTGVINGGGGIYGYGAGATNVVPGSSTAINCYSIGPILLGGGIFAGGYTINCLAYNCYTSGSMTGLPNGGIYQNSLEDNLQGADNYAEGNHSSSEWNDINSLLYLTGTPSSSPIGSIWAQLNSTNSPYILASAGYSPYSASLSKTFSASLVAGGTTESAVVPGYTFSFLAINGTSPSSYPTFSINSSTGAITAGQTTNGGNYTLIIYSSINPYSITTYTLTVSAVPAVPVNAEGVSCCARPIDIGKDVDYDTRNKFATGNTMIGGIQNRQPYASYTMLLYKQMAFAAKR